jgi:hypothetical protein
MGFTNGTCKPVIGFVKTITEMYCLPEVLCLPHTLPSSRRRGRRRDTLEYSAAPPPPPPPPRPGGGPSAAASGPSVDLLDVASLDASPTSSSALRAVLEWQRRKRQERKQQQQQQASSAEAGSSGAASASAPVAAQPPLLLLDPPGLPPSALSDDSVAGLLLGFDLSGLLRCVHVHKVTGRLGQFRDYYLEQRRLQVGGPCRGTCGHVGRRGRRGGWCDRWPLSQTCPCLMHHQSCVLNVAHSAARSASHPL